MLQSYIGIVGQRGLELFCREHPHTLRFLWRRCQRRKRQAICIWTVIPEEYTREIQASVRNGQTKEAWRLVQTLAHDGGTFLPSEESFSRGVKNNRSV